MKRLIPLVLSVSLALSLLSACGSPGAETTVVPPNPTQENTAEPAATQPEQAPQEPSLALPTHHPEEETHHVEPEPTHHAEESHHTESEHPHHSAAATPAPTPKPTPAPTPAPTPSPAGVDLAAFYEDVTNMHEFGFLQLADSTLLDGYYPGMTGIDTEQCLVYVCAMSMNNGEFGLVQVKNSGDVAAVKAIFQARINYMVGDGNGPGGAQYPMAMDQWENNSRIVSSGNYVMMVVHENCDDIVSQFNALF